MVFTSSRHSKTHQPFPHLDPCITPERCGLTIIKIQLDDTPRVAAGVFSDV
jgi:hypothetical protein